VATPRSSYDTAFCTISTSTYYGAYIAVMSPPTISMALRVRDVVGEGRPVSTLSTVLSVGAFAAAVASRLATDDRWLPLEQA
jgi:hypothetical protein